MKRQAYLSTVLIILLFGVFQACGEDPASMGGAIPPELPQFEEISIDDSYFRKNGPAEPQSQQFESFVFAKQGILLISSELLSILELPKAMLIGAENIEPFLTSGIWAWEYGFIIPAELVEEENDITTEVRVTAQAGNPDNETVWSIFVSAEETPVGPLDRFNLANATLTNNGTTGILEFFNPEEPEISILDVAWNTPSEDEKTLNMLFRDEGEQNVGITEIIFSQNGTAYSFSVYDSFNETEVIITWNTLTGTGAINTPDGLFCWDEYLMNIACGSS